MKYSKKSNRRSPRADETLTSSRRQTAGKGQRGGGSVSEQAKAILSILTRHAGEECGPLTYADLARETGIAHCALRAPMNCLSAALGQYQTASRKRIPPLQALVVNAKTGVPGAGAWRHIGKPYGENGAPQHLTIEEQRSIIAQIHIDIAHYPDWRVLEQALTGIL